MSMRNTPTGSAAIDLGLGAKLSQDVEEQLNARKKKSSKMSRLDVGATDASGMALMLNANPVRMGE